MTSLISDSIKEMHNNQVSGSYLVFLRLTLGFAFLTTWFSNFLDGTFTVSGYRDILNYYINDNLQTPFNDFVETVLIPNAQIFSTMQIILELIIAFSLIFGLFTRFGSLIGFLVSVNLFFLTLGHPNEWVWTYILMIIGFFMLFVYSAGRWYGLDFWLEKRVSSKKLHWILF